MSTENGHNPLTRHIAPEQAVLGAILAMPAGMEVVSQLLQPADFLMPEHRAIYGAMAELWEHQSPPDIVLLASSMNGTLESAGGIPYLASLANLCPNCVRIRDYAVQVREQSRRRQLLAAGEALRRAADDPARAIEEAEAVLQAAKRGGAVEPWEGKGSRLDRLLERLTSPADVDVLPTGLRNLDRIITGFRRGDLVTVGARPSVGKTSLAVTMAFHASMRVSRHVLFFSLEMLDEVIWEKLASLETGLSWTQITSHSLAEREATQLGEALTRLKAAPIDVVPAREWSAAEIRAAAAEIQRKAPLSLVVVDYLQLVRADGRHENRVREVSAISESLKGMALELECPVLALSQLNREPEHGVKRDPRMSELRESGSIENDSDVVILLDRPNGRQEPRPAVETIAAIVDKNRMGETGKVLLGFRGSHMQFVDLEPGQAGPVAAVRSFLNRHDADEEPF